MPTPPQVRWSEIRGLFEELIELHAHDRERALFERCAGDTALMNAVRAMLEADEGQVTPGLETAAGHAAYSRLSDARAAATTVAIEGFEVRRLIASGGMGAVYEAEQHHPRRLVALKVLRPELGTGSTLQRFRVEAEVLGRLQHPGIAEVYAAGVQRTRSGPFDLELPWYALELLPAARSLTEHAREQHLGVRAVIELVREASEAMHHAHLRGVIHRDLKPANILVGAAGEPKIVDFGIARVSGEPGSEGLTATGMVLGTPAYMAPEQRRAEADLDLRCDVFSLGVVLFELLTGRLPEGDDASSDLKPSAYRTELDQELDWIVSKATATDRIDRYDTALALAEDLTRYLNEDTIVAAPPSRMYRLRKAARRYRLLLFVAFSVFVALSVGLIASLMALDRAWRAESEATEERNKVDRLLVEKAGAFEELREKSEMNDGIAAAFRTSILKSVGRAEGRETTIADFCAELSAVLDDENFTPLLRASVANLLATASQSNADFKTAVDYHQRSIELLVEAGKGEGIDEIVARGNLADCLRFAGDAEACEKELQRALVLGEKHLELDSQTHLQNLGRQVQVLLDAGDLSGAEGLALEVHEKRTRVLGPTHQDTVDAQLYLIYCWHCTSQFERVVAEGNVAMPLVAQAFGVAHAKQVNLTNLIAVALINLGRVTEAIERMEAMLEPARAALVAGHPDLLEMQSTLGQACLRARSDFELGIDAVQDTYHHRSQRLPIGHADLDRTARTLGRLLLEVKRYQNVIEVLEKHLKSYRACDPSQRAGALDGLVSYARALSGVGRRTEAEELLETLAADVAETLPAADPQRKKDLEFIAAWRASLAGS